MARTAAGVENEIQFGPRRSMGCFLCSSWMSLDLKPRERCITYPRFVIPEMDEDAGNAHLFYILVVSISQRHPLQQHLERLEIASAAHYPPLHSSPAGETLGRYVTSHDIASRVAGQLLRLPLYPDMSDADVRRVADGVKRFFAQWKEERLARL